MGFISRSLSCNPRASCLAYSICVCGGGGLLHIEACRSCCLREKEEKRHPPTQLGLKRSKYTQACFVCKCFFFHCLREEENKEKETDLDTPKDNQIDRQTNIRSLYIRSFLFVLEYRRERGREIHTDRQANKHTGRPADTRCSTMVVMAL